MAESGIHLRGIAWDHTRGLMPMVATAQRFTELHPDVRISWTARSLQAFADHSMSELAAEYDLIVMDHPWAGATADDGITVALNELLSAEFLADRAANSVGGSYTSYLHGGCLVGLDTDAAAPVAASRPDLLERAGLTVPTTWEELLGLARLGHVAFAAIPIDMLMAFYMVCSTMGADPFQHDQWSVSRELGTTAFELIIELVSHCSPAILDLNPIRLYEAMTAGDDIAYSPFAYGYSNYSRPGYARRQLKFHDLVQLSDHGPCRTTLGGAGLAISHSCAHPEIAARYVEFVGDRTTQSTLYFDSGGQPGHRSAWTDERVNALSLDFFSDTLPALDRAYVRNTFAGYLDFQDRASILAHDCVAGRRSIPDTLDELERNAVACRRS